MVNDTKTKKKTGSNASKYKKLRIHIMYEMNVNDLIKDKVQVKRSINQKIV